MFISTFDLFSVGIGPSSSHTVGPMRAAAMFLASLEDEQLLDSVRRVKAEMFGSLGATGKGHGTPKAVLMGLEGEFPETIDVSAISNRVAVIKEEQKLSLNKKHSIDFDYEADLILNRKNSLPLHSNGMQFIAFDNQGNTLLEKRYYSVGGGFVHDDEAITAETPLVDTHKNDEFYDFASAKELLELCKTHRLSISELMLHNESVNTDVDIVKSQLISIWDVMAQSVKNGCNATGILPGGLNVPRRAPQLYQQLSGNPEKGLNDPLTVTDWVTLYALAVNEENAAGGRIVTAPTNGAAGIIPAVMHYYKNFVPHANNEGLSKFLLTAAAIGTLYKKNASISGAEVGCQGEVGSACSMAAGALCEVMGGTPEQVENAAEIGMEHNLGLTCDPIGGLVQVPCIERNAMASIKAISACRMALLGNGSHFVSLDKVIKTMRDTGRDMRDKYKETSRGGLAINVLEVPVNIVEC
ncbi:L-serine dehydratase [gamma proteobacterium IMCC1989]|nr:L-serine dehydratase [gamma proteobacterium IMCC1989]